MDRDTRRKTDLYFQKWHKKDQKIFVQRLNNRDFILESKVTELNQNQNWKQPDRPSDQPRITRNALKSQVFDLFAKSSSGHK